MYYTAPDMDPAYDVVMRRPLPGVTVAELAQAIREDEREAEGDEDHDQEEWVGLCRKELLSPTMTMIEVFNRVPAGKKVKINFVRRSDLAERASAERASASAAGAQVRLRSGERTTGANNHAVNMTAARALSSEPARVITSGDDVLC